MILGAGNRIAVGTLVERTSRYVLLLHLGADKSAVAVERAMRTAILTLPAELHRSVTGLAPGGGHLVRENNDHGEDASGFHS